jgi:hypothetical protein
MDLESLLFQILLQLYRDKQLLQVYLLVQLVQLLSYQYNNTLASGTGLVTGLFSANISPVVNIDLNTINGLASSLSIASASVHGV